MNSFFTKLIFLCCVGIECLRQTILCITGKPTPSHSKTIHQNPTPPSTNPQQPDPTTLQAQKLCSDLQSAEHFFMRAIKNGNMSDVQALIDCEVDVNAEINGLRPIRIAIAHNQKDILSFLLSLQNPKITITQEDVTCAKNQIKLVKVSLKQCETMHDLVYPHVARTEIHQRRQHCHESKKALRVYKLLANRHKRNNAQLKVE